MESDELSMREAAAALGISSRTIRRYVRALRDAVGPVQQGILTLRGRRVAFRRVPGVRNDEYRFWLDRDVVPGAPPEPPDALHTVLKRLDEMQAAISALDERVGRMERGGDRS